MIVQPDLSEFGSRNRTISRLQKEGPHIHSDNPSSVAILQVPTFSVRLHLYIYPTILHDPLCPKLFWGETSQHKPSPKIHPPTKNGMNNQQSNNLHQLSMGKKRRKKKHPSNLNHPLVCVCVLPGKRLRWEVDTKDLKEVELSDVPKGRLSLRCFYESVGDAQGQG